MPLYADVCGSTLTYAEILTHKAKEEMSRSIFFRRITEVFLYFDEYTNILKDMYITRFNGRPADREASVQAHSVPRVPTPPFITSPGTLFPRKCLPHSPAAQGLCEASPSFSFTLALSLSPHRHPFSIFPPGSRLIRFLFMYLSMCVFV